MTEEMITECMDVMMEWVTLLHRGIRSECPSFELLQSLAVFNLEKYGDDLAKKDAAGVRYSATDELDENSTTELNLCLQRLANLAERPDDVGLLRKQVDSVRPFAKRLYDVEGLCIRGAWGQAVQRRLVNEAKNKWRDKLYSDGYELLKTVLSYFVAWDWSTQALENTIGISKRVFDSHRQSSSIDLEQDELDILFGDSSMDHQMACEARRLWTKFYALTRERVLLRMDKGVKKGANVDDEEEPTASQFKRQRWHKLKEAVKDADPVQLNAKAVPQGGWSSEKVAVEAKFQDTKFRKKMVEEACSKRPTLTSEELASIPKAELDEFMKERTAADRNYINGKLKSRKIVGGPTMPTLKGNAVFVEPDLQVSDADAAKFAKKFDVVVSSEKLKASIFVVQDVTLPGQRNKWLAVMCGGYLMSVEAFKSAGQIGAVLKFKPANVLRKTWYLSNAFMAAHGAIANIVAESVTRPGANLKVVQGGPCPWVSVKSASTRAHANRYLALITKKEQKSKTFGSVRSNTAGQALETLSKLDEDHCFAGYSGC